ncbi:MAG: RNA polymerase sigma factor, partial [Planctomycetes bacterium]|nr:RNA polymerase sigma factor [Planctomycetota bacterium]
MNAQEQILGLLGTYRHRIYNVCYQVLRHEQDAEDTAQEVLLDLLDVMGRIRDEEHLRRWAHRAAFHRALNAKRGRKRRAEHERARGSAVEAGGLPEETADAIHGAVSRLDDSLRELVVEHYYEKATLEDLAERKGCSSVAIWKRLQKATERLKQELGRVGLGGMVAHVEPYLKSLTPARSPASVLAKHVIAKVAAVAAAGGLVATKSVL